MGAAHHGALPRRSGSAQRRWTSGERWRLVRGLQVWRLLLWALWPYSGHCVKTLLKGLAQPQGIAVDAARGQIYWTEVGTKSLLRSNLNGKQKEVVVPPSQHTEGTPYSVALDTEAGKVYWTTECCTIRRANLNGTDLEHLVNVTYAGGISLDVNNSKMYWTSHMDGMIWRANLNGSGQELVLHKDLWMPIDLAVDSRTQQLYWVDIGKKIVERASLDDVASREVLNVSWAIKQQNGLALDTRNEKIYLTASETGRPGSIYRATLDGAENEVLVSTGEAPHGIAFDAINHAVYWTDETAGTIQRLTLRCTPGSTVVYSPQNTSSARVSWGQLEHSTLHSVDCPANFSGQVKLACNDGVVSISSGQCARNCLPGNITEGNDTILHYDGIEDGMFLDVGCAEELVGPLYVKCNDGVVSRAGGRCRVPRSCPSGKASLKQSVEIRHASMAHGEQSNGSCPEGFDGTYTLQCYDGTARGEGNCRASCMAGSLWVGSEYGADRVEVSHYTIKSGVSLHVACPEGSAGEGVQLTCAGGTLRVDSAKCYTSSRCRAGSQQVHGAVIGHGGLSEGDMVVKRCPSGFIGEVQLTCRRGETIVQSGSCSAECKAGAVLDSNGVSIHVNSAQHGGHTFGVCPLDFKGVIPVVCRNGSWSIRCGPLEQCKCLSLQAYNINAVGGRIVHADGESHGLAPQTLVPAGLGVALTMCLVGFGVIQFCSRKDAAGHKGRGSLAIAATTTSSSSTAGKESSSGSHAERGSSSPPFITVESPVPVPPYWATGEGVHIFQDPNRMEEVQRLMTETWRVKGTRDRALLSGTDHVPTSCRVANVLRVENHQGYHQYWKHKAEVMRNRADELEPFPMDTDRRLNLLDDDCNEKYLFHGTNPEAAHAIAKNLFSIDLAGTSRGCMFGHGIYLAENASKSDEYAKEGDGVYVGLCAMLICRAVAGKVFTAEAAGDFSGFAKKGEYDSVCGDRLAAAGTYREMVFFHEEAVYPEFIVIYTRE